MYVLNIPCRSKNDFKPLYILVEVEGRVQYNQPIRLGDSHPGIELRTVCGELRARKTRYAICSTIPGVCKYDDDNKHLVKMTGKDLMHGTTQSAEEHRKLACSQRIGR